MLAVRKDDARDRYAALVLHGVAYDRECVLAALAVWHHVVGTLIVSLVDIGLGHELLDVDRMRALYLDGFEIRGAHLDILAFRDFVAAPFLVLADFLARHLIDHLLAQPMAGLAADLVKVRFLALAGRRIESDLAAHER